MELPLELAVYGYGDRQKVVRMLYAMKDVVWLKWLAPRHELKFAVDMMRSCTPDVIVLNPKTDATEVIAAIPAGVTVKIIKNHFGSKRIENQLRSMITTSEVS